MSFMRLGTRCAVIDEEGHILLSKRGDFGTWSLPGGRLDSGELLPDSAVREVREETGLEVEIVRAVGLYYQEGRSRMNILYQAQPTGGKLLSATDETLENRFFHTDTLPDNIFGEFYIDDALEGGVHVEMQEADPAELRKLRWKLAVRWVQNLLSGKPEPRFPQFEVQAVGLIWDDAHENLLSLTSKPELVHIISDGQLALNHALNQRVGLDMDWNWIGLWQNTATDRMIFVFENTFNFELENLRRASASWHQPTVFNDSLTQRLLEATHSQQTETVWLLTEE